MEIEVRETDGGTILLTCMVIIRPSVCAFRETTVSKVVYDAFIWVFLRAHEDQAERSVSKQ